MRSSQQTVVHTVCYEHDDSRIRSRKYCALALFTLHGMTTVSYLCLSSALSAKFGIERPIAQSFKRVE